jgi:hypothetical protein
MSTGLFASPLPFAFIIAITSDNDAESKNVDEKRTQYTKSKQNETKPDGKEPVTGNV